MNFAFKRPLKAHRSFQAIELTLVLGEKQLIIVVTGNLATSSDGYIQRLLVLKKRISLRANILVRHLPLHLFLLC